MPSGDGTQPGIFLPEFAHAAALPCGCQAEALDLINADADRLAIAIQVVRDGRATLVVRIGQVCGKGFHESGSGGTSARRFTTLQARLEKTA